MNTVVGWFLVGSFVLCWITMLGAYISDIRYRRRYRMVHGLPPSWVKDVFNTAPFERLEWLFTRQQNRELENLRHVAVTWFVAMLVLYIEVFVIFALASAILPPR